MGDVVAAVVDPVIAYRKDAVRAAAPGEVILDGDGNPLGGAASPALDYLGTWNANTNTPALSNGSGSAAGEYYIVSVAGSTALDGVSSWGVGDWVIFSGAVWQKIDNEDVAAVWGGITGTLTNQTDLQNALDAKQDELAEGPFVDGDKTALDTLATAYTNDLVTKTGTPVDAQLAVFTAAKVVEGATGLSYTASVLKVDSVGEYTADAGVTAEGVLLKDNKVTAGSLAATNLVTGDEIITTDISGNLQESGAKIIAAPAGGSGLVVVEYASAPVAPPTGMFWVRRVNATTVAFEYFDGTDTYTVEATA